MLDWLEEVLKVRASASQKFSEVHRAEAARWGTCRVGEWHQKLPEVVRYVLRSGDINTSPVDARLLDLGTRFANAVTTHRVATAEQLLHEIDVRVMELKREGQT